MVLEEVKHGAHVPPMSTLGPASESSPGTLTVTGGRAMSNHRNLAARMAHWSGQHRKQAIFGWLAFAILAFAIGNMVGSKPISDVDQFSGESHDAEAALDRAGLRPTA